MESQKFEAYRHSGKYSMKGPVLAVLLSAVAALALGLLYTKLMQWIPLIYFNFLLTAGYGFAFGWVIAKILRSTKTRNTAVAVICGLIGGMFALYGEWSAHIRNLFEVKSLLLMPDQVFVGMQVLYEFGSWSLKGGDAVSGVLLGIVWVAEAVTIIGFSVVLPYKAIADVPFCERNQCWLDEERNIDTLASFVDPGHLQTFRNGDLAPLAEAVPRPLGSVEFTRLTMKSSAMTDDFCTVIVANVTQTTDKEGKTTEKVKELTSQLVLPKLMLEMITRFDRFDTAHIAS